MGRAPAALSFLVKSSRLGRPGCPCHPLPVELPSPRAGRGEGAGGEGVRGAPDRGLSPEYLSFTRILRCSLCLPCPFSPSPGRRGSRLLAPHSLPLLRVWGEGVLSLGPSSPAPSPRLRGEGVLCLMPLIPCPFSPLPGRRGSRRSRGDRSETVKRGCLL